MADRRYLQTKEIASRLGCTVETVRRWYREGKLDGAAKIGGPTSPIRISEQNLKRIMRKGGKKDAVSSNT